MKEEEKKDCKIISIEEWRKDKKKKEEQEIYKRILERGEPKKEK